MQIELVNIATCIIHDYLSGLCLDCLTFLFSSFLKPGIYAMHMYFRV